MEDETKKIISETEEIALGVQGRFWEIIRDKLTDKIMELDGINQFKDKSDAEGTMLELGAKQMAMNILIEWANEIFGEALSVNDLKKKSIKEKFIYRQ